MKHALTMLISVSSIVLSHGQTISKKEAQQFLQRSWSYIEKQDSVSFANLWSLNDSESKNQRRPHGETEVLGEYRAVREWLDTALVRGLKIDHIEVESTNLEGTDTKYWIQAWFKYDRNHEKGFGFYVAYVGNKWVVRDNASTSYLSRT